MSDRIPPNEAGRPQLSEEELRALEAEMDRITVDDVLLQTIVSLLHLGARKAGLGASPGEGPPPDLEQVRQAIEGARALLPLVEARHGDKLGPVRDTLSRLQMLYAQAAGQAPGGEPAPPEPASPEPDAPQEPAAESEGEAPRTGEPGPAQRSGRLWVPGQ
jgi:hypothetical protein